MAALVLVFMACSPGAERSPAPSSQHVPLRLAEVATLAAPTWNPEPPMAQDHESHTATLLRDGQVLVVGGYDPSSHIPHTRSELYDPLAHTWSPAGTLSWGRYRHTATLLADGRVLVVGGYDPSLGAPLASSELYDPVTRTWTAASALSEARFDHTATLLADGKVLVVGGGTTLIPDQYNPASRCEVYDPATNTWSPAGSLLEAREGHTATLLADGKVLILGGTASGDYDPPNEIYDPVFHISYATGWLVANRYHSAATLLPDGKVLAIGAADAYGFIEEYDPSTNSWSLDKVPVVESREGHTATLLRNGKVLIVGGGPSCRADLPPRGGNPSAVVYDPRTRTAIATATLAQGRSHHTATVLNSGKVLVTGGWTDSAGGRTPSVELFGPPDLKTRFSTAPANPTNQSTATFGFSANGTAVSFMCSLDESGFQSCSNPFTTPPLAEGFHSLRVQARDEEGFMEDEPVSYSWAIDVTAPETSLGPSAPPSHYREKTATFDFTSNEAGARFECRLDGAAFNSCTVPMAYADLAEGGHSFEVRAIDRAGNADASSARYSWEVDTLRPALPSLQEPTPGQRLFTSTPRFSGTTEPGATVTLLVDGMEAGLAQADDQGAWSVLFSAALSWGEHRVSARATDRAGNSSDLLPEVPFSTHRRSNYRSGCSAGSSGWRGSWPWALLLLGLLRPRSRPV